MQLIGDLERFVAQNLYPLRLPVGVVGLAVVIGLVLLARRRGWLQVARGHPIRTAVVAAGMLLVLAPVTWYLASPLFISTSVVEAAPPAANATLAVPTDAATPAASTTDGPPAGASPGAEPSATASVGNGQPSSPPASETQERSGTFVGADEFHFGRGTARLIAGADGAWTLRFEDFAVRNGPDLYVYLSPRPKRYADGALELGRLKADTGAFNYRLPAGADPADYRSVIVWCKQFAVQFAHATLEP
jgi:Electron transfer DM13